MRVRRLQTEEEAATEKEVKDMGESNPEKKTGVNPAETRPSKDREATKKGLGRTAIGGATKK